MDRRVLWRGALLLLILLAFALRVSGLAAQSMWRDEVDALRFSQAPVKTLLGYLSLPGWNGPLFYFLLRLWIGLVGRSELAMRTLSLWFGVLGVALLYRLGREWFSPWIGGLAALLMAASPYMVWYAQDLKMYALLCALALAAIYLYRRALHGDDWRLWAMVILLVWVTVAVHVIGGLLVPWMAVLGVVWWPVVRSRWRLVLASLLMMVLPGLVLAALRSGTAGEAVRLLLQGGYIGYTFVPLVGMVSILAHAFSRGITGVGGIWPLGLALFGLLAGTLLWPQGRPAGAWFRFVRGGALTSPGTGEQPTTEEGRSVLSAWLWLIVPVLGLYVISLRVPLFVDRYLIWIGPAFYLLIARGIDQVRRRVPVAAALYVTALLALNGWGVWAQATQPIKSDWRAAAAYVRQGRQPDELVMFHISYVREAFEYYYGDASPDADGIPTDDLTKESAVDAAMRERTRGYGVVWLVLSEPEMWDRRGMTAAWLDQHAQIEARADFARVSVIRYRLPPVY